MKAIAEPRRQQILRLVWDEELAAPQGLADLKAFLDEFWGDRLEALKREAEREERSKRGKRD